MLLYNSATSGNCYKVRLLLAQLGIEYEIVELSVVDRSNRAEVLGELNPGLRVPTLVLDDGRPLAESNAILWYFGDGTQFAPDDPYERAQVLQWQFFEKGHTRGILADNSGSPAFARARAGSHSRDLLERRRKLMGGRRACASAKDLACVSEPRSAALART